METIPKGIYQPMNFWKIIKKSLTEACVIFCVIFALIAIFVLSLDKGEGLYSLGQTFLFFIFALIFAMANAVMRTKSLSFGLRLFLHFLITAIGFYLCFMLYMGMAGTQIIIGFFLYAVVYAIAALIIGLFVSRFRKIKNAHSDYENKFQKAESKK